MSVSTRPLADREVAWSASTAPVDPAHSTQRPSRLWLLVGVVLVLGAGLRMVRASDPMLEYFPTRQYMSVDLAWKYDMALGAQAEPGDRDASEILDETEPPIMESITAVIWRATGERALWVPRLLTVMVWSAGGLALALLLRRLAASAVGVVVGVVAWTFIPFVVQATRVFQPDPLMVTAVMFAVLALVVDDDRRTTRSLVIAGLIAGFAVFVKAPAAFFVVPTFVAVTWFGRGWRALWSRRTLAYGALAIGFALTYNVLGIVVLHYLDGKAGLFIFPHLLLTAHFWSQWLSLVLVTYGVALVTMAALGIATAAGRARAVGAGLVVGYVAYGLVFTWNYSTHHYYHLPLITAVALGLGLVASKIDATMRRRQADLLSVGVATVAVVCFVGGFFFSLWRFVPPPADAASVERNVVVSAEVGDVVDHSSHVIALVEHYGYPLAYYGSIKSVPWPHGDDLHYQEAKGDAPLSLDQRFDELATQAQADFFVVIDMDEWNQQPDLQAYLRSRFPVRAETPEYVVFDLREGAANDG